MTQSVEGFVQVPPNSTGPQLRQLQITLPQPNGTFATVLMEVVSIADKDGYQIDLGQKESLSLQRATLLELRDIRRAMSVLTGIQYMGSDGMGLLDPFSV